MPAPVLDTTNPRIAAGAREKRRGRVAAGLVWSVLLHGLVLAAVILMLGRTDTADDVFIPVTIVTLADETAGPAQPIQAPVPEQKSGRASAPAVQPLGMTPRPKPPVPDALEIKLRKLAELRQPLVDTRSSDKDIGASRMAAARADLPFASYATVRDFLRAAIERRWGPDLSILAGRNFNVLLRVEITRTGVVKSAEVLNNYDAGVGQVYEQIANSARNAVLLSSPFSLPPGHYPDVMELVLILNTREALR